MHLCEPLAVMHRQCGNTLFIHDIDRTERPAVCLECFSVVFCRITSAIIVGVRLDDRALILEPLIKKTSYPRTRDDVRALRLAGVKLDCNLTSEITAHPVIHPDESLRTQISRKINDRFLTCSFLVRDVNITACSRLLCCHMVLLSFMPF